MANGLLSKFNNTMAGLPMSANLGLLNFGASLLDGGKIGNAVQAGLGTYRSLADMEEEKKRRLAIQGLLADGNYTDQERALIEASANPVPVALQIKKSKESQANFSTLNPNELKALGFPEGSIVQKNSLTGQLDVVDKATVTDRKIIEGKDGFKYYADTGGRVFPNIKDKPEGTRWGMPQEQYNDLSSDGKKIVDNLGLQGIKFGTPEFNIAAKDLVTNTQEGWQIINPESDQYKLAIEQAFPNGAPKELGGVLMGKGNDIKFVKLQSSKTNVNVNLGGKSLEVITKELAKQGREIIFDANGLPQRDKNNQIMTRVIPGGKADLEIQETEKNNLEIKKRNFKSAQTKEIEKNTINRSIESIFDILAPKNADGVRVPKTEKGNLSRLITGDLPEAGVVGEGFANLGMFSSQESRDIQLLLKPIKASVGFGRLQRMRSESKTGGALGNVSNVELELLQNSLEAIDQGLSPEKLYENLQNVQNIYTKILNDPVANTLLAANSEEEFDRLLKLLDEKGQIPGSNNVGNNEYSKMTRAELVKVLVETDLKSLTPKQTSALLKRWEEVQ